MIWLVTRQRCSSCGHVQKGRTPLIAPLLEGCKCELCGVVSATVIEIICESPPTSRTIECEQESAVEDLFFQYWLRQRPALRGH